jgi:hypothetical protein
MQTATPKRRALSPLDSTKLTVTPGSFRRKSFDDGCLRTERPSTPRPFVRNEKAPEELSVNACAKLSPMNVPEISIASSSHMHPTSILLSYRIDAKPVNHVRRRSISDAGPRNKQPSPKESSEKKVVLTPLQTEQKSPNAVHTRRRSYSETKKTIPRPVTAPKPPTTKPAQAPERRYVPKQGQELLYNDIVAGADGLNNFERSEVLLNMLHKATSDFKATIQGFVAECKPKGAMESRAGPWNKLLKGMKKRGSVKRLERIGSFSLKKGL